ncbi:sensor domain-containing diguanylate cyclase [Legionella maioricensis]|uniref:Sensor domain-containing diguanylate cyclase n=1 Tax=Legionella maioricensis TaxID=2896528 RepID=A0A9X2CXV0_9GAMM|nr:sensor domain-containing diguanylate cyclase [Legionella maioricensis]MCL9682798.1 sensor domain-containing diguanylate cyclase [Legionella maioricensis]MCL9686574.1 sensor domain-containing diguanylate cyclase [Legionella maioricensis]
MVDLNKYKTNLLLKLEGEQIIFDLISNGITITNQDSLILYTNPAFTNITGYTKEEVKGKNIGMIHSGYHDKLFYENMWDSITRTGVWEGEIWNRRKSGEIFPEFLTISQIEQDKDRLFFYIAVFSDITFLKSDINKKFHLAFYDPLTELSNRNMFYDRLNKLREKKITVFYMDLDKFKEVNDTYGHCIGDTLLNYVGKRLASICRAEDIVARIGGDEFAVILQSDSSKASAMELSERIVNSIEQPFNIDGRSISISISIGISFYPGDANYLEGLVSNADKAMYKAKKSGSKIECFDE